MALSAPISSLDVSKAAANGAQPIYALTNDLLERLGANGKLNPSLATSVTTPSDTTIVYQLRPNVKFSNGDALTSQDVAWSLTRDFASGTPYGGFLTSIKSVAATSANTVTVTLKTYDPTARAIIASGGFVYDQSQAQANSKDFGTQSAVPVGTGPYRLVAWTGNGVTLEQNPTYWGPKPAVGSFKFTVITSDNTAQLAMRSGSIQGALITNPATIAQWKAISGTTIYSLPPALVTYLSFDVASAPFDDVHVRNAIAHAVDRSGLVNAIYHGQANVAQSVVDVSKVGAVAPSLSAAQQFLDGLPEYNYDLDQAKTEMAKSRYPNGFTTTLPYLASDNPSSVTAQSIQHTLKSIGITVTLRPLQFSEFYAQLYAHKDLGMQLSSRAGAGTGEPAEFLGILVGKANAVPNGANTANYYPPNVEQAWGVLTKSPDRSARWQATQTILTQMADDLPYVALFNAPWPFAVSGGFTLSGAASLADVQNGGLPFLLS